MNGAGPVAACALYSSSCAPQMHVNDELRIALAHMFLYAMGDREPSAVRSTQQKSGEILSPSHSSGHNRPFRGHQSNKNMSRTHVRRGSIAALMAGLGLLACVVAQADDACPLTPSELQTLTGRAFGEGEASKNLGDGSPLCHYAEKDNPRRKLTIGVSSTNAQRQFESRMRLLKTGSKSIELQGVGDRAYFNGTAAGVLSGDKLITVSNLRRASDPEIAAEKVVALLQAVLKKS